MITLDDLDRLKAEVERRRQEKSRAEGALAEILKRLKSEFGVSSLKEAKTLLQKLDADKQKLEAEFAEAKEVFEKEFGNKLQEG